MIDDWALAGVSIEHPVAAKVDDDVFPTDFITHSKEVALKLVIRWMIRKHLFWVCDGLVDKLYDKDRRKSLLPVDVPLGEILVREQVSIQVSWLIFTISVC